ncbi:MAG: CDP-alcohol phosphatidyltransferase family protein, partial [Pseudomonadales bacterium]
MDGVNSGLIHELRLINFLGWIMLLICSFAMCLVMSWNAVIQWLIQSGVLWWYVIYQASSRIERNRLNLESPLYPDLGWGNRLTILRGWFIATVGGFLFQDWPASYIAWLPGMLYLFAAAIDRVDGYVARRTRHISLLGIELDTVVDALGLAVVSLLAVWYGQIHWSYLLLGCAYYLFQFGIYHRRKLGLPVYQLPPGIYRRAWAGFQMGFLVVVLLPVFQPPVTTIAGIAFMLPALIGFVIDWLIVSGRINRQATGVVQLFDRLQHFTQSGLQPLVRIAIFVMLVSVVAQSDYTFVHSVNSSWKNPVIYGFILTAIMILAGIAGRTAAIILIGLLGW